MKRRRNTKQRQFILEAVKSHTDHPTAERIYQDMQAIDPKISRSTVYRNLRLLTQSGELRRVTVADVDQFDCRLDRHHHLQCSRCGAVADAPLAYQPQLDQQIAEESGFAIKEHHTVFVGLCPKCRSKDLPRTKEI